MLYTEEFLASKEWATISDLRKRIDNYTCTRCGCKSQDLVAHHISYEIKNDQLGLLDLSLLQTVCRRCHCEIHAMECVSTVDDDAKQIEIELLAYLCIFGNFGLYREFIQRNPDYAISRYDFREEIQKTMYSLLNKLVRDEYVYPRYIENAFASDRAHIDARRMIIESNHHFSKPVLPEVKKAVFEEFCDIVLRLRAQID